MEAVRRLETRNQLEPLCSAIDCGRGGCEWIEGTLGPEGIRRGAQLGDDPSAGYGSPQDVLRDQTIGL